MITLEAKHLVKQYGGQTAVKDLSFQLESNSIYGLLGPNGAGKSTTMNMITGYITPTSGEVSINGCNIQENPEQVRKYIGYLPEIPPLYMEMTIKEYLITAAELKGIPKAKLQQEIDSAMERLILTDKKDRLIRNLSKGYRQRVGIAQALLGDPQIIILDEPTVGLDPRQILEIRSLVKELGKTHTVILSSHILSEISAVCDYVLIVNKGELMAEGEVSELEHMVRGQNRLELVAEGSEETLRNIFRSFSQIRAVKMEMLEDKGVAASVEDDIKTKSACFSVELQLAHDADIRRELFYKMAEERCPILEMKESSLSLEDVFLEIVENPDPADPQ